MRRFFCDICNRPMEKVDANRVRRTLGRVRIEVLVSLDHRWNGGDICESCVLDAVIKGEPDRRNREGIVWPAYPNETTTGTPLPTGTTTCGGRPVETL